MSTQLSETILLELIEGELDAEARAAAERALAADPALRAALDGMMRDRDALRALPEPALPRDFVAELEPLLARPLLVEGAFRPGVLRRRRKREARQRRLRRLAVAALVVLAASAGLFAAGALVVGGVRWAERVGGDSGEMLVRTPREPEPVVREDNVPVRTVLELAGGIVHHRWRVDDLPAPSATAVPDPRPSLPPRPAEVALVVPASAGGALEEATAALMSEAGAQVALVRNLTFDEARRIELQWIAERSRREPGSAPQAVAGSSGGRLDTQALDELARRVAERRALRQAAPRSDDAVSGVIAGSRAVMPPYEQQLAFADRGATLCVAVPVDRLGVFLELVDERLDAAAVLRLLGSSDETPAGSALSERAAVLERLAALSDAGDGVIWLPVILR